jgi:hypothetical protein
VRGKNKHVAVDGADEGDATETAPAAARKEGKGKGKSKSKQVEEEEDDDDEEGEGVYSRGPVPQAIQDRLAALKESFHSQVADLAAECNKSPTVLHRILGTTSASPRALAPWNIHQMKYAVDVPFKDSGRECSSFFLCFIWGLTQWLVSPTEYTKASRAAFLTACGDVDTSDAEAVFRKLPELRQWHHKTMENAILQLTDDGKLKSKVQTALKPLMDQVR